MLLIPPNLQTASDVYYSVIAARQDAYDKTLASGRYQPFVYPWDSTAAALLFLAMLVVPRVPTRHKAMLKIGTAAWIFYFGIQTMLKSRCLGFANGYGIGLMCAWGMIMTVTLLFCNNIGEDMQRLEWRDPTVQVQTHSIGNASGSATSAEMLDDAAIKKRRVYGVDGTAVSANAIDSNEPATKPYTLVWQDYPISILHCMEWTADLMTTFRGVGWNWRISTCPPLDIPVQSPEEKLKPRNTESTSPAKPTTLSLPTLRQLQLTALRDFIAHYLILDFLKTIMITDPYFMGVSDLASPSPWPYLISLNSPTIIKWLLTRFIRLTISVCGVLSALTFIFSLSPLFFIGVLTTLIPAHYVRRITRSPILEPSLYPPYWLPLATVTDGGLAAFWGKWWHQMFRFGLSEPSRALIQYFDLDRKGKAARLLQLGIAFALSGFIHASASFTTFSASEPLTGPLTFFALQALGIIVQQQVTVAAKTYLQSVYSSSRVRKTSNVVFVVMWLYLTGPLLANDFARCGIWLFEPVPISPLRGIIWGDWWVWKNVGAWAGWHTGSTWYTSGLAIY